MAAQAMAQFRFSPLSSHYRYHYQYNYHSTPSFPSPRRHPRNQRLHLSFSGGDRGGSGGGGGGGDSDGGGGDNEKNVGLGVVGMVLNGWRSRVAADPQFPFKVLMEELDFVFSTLVVGSILNFILLFFFLFHTTLDLLPHESERATVMRQLLHDRRMENPSS